MTNILPLHRGSASSHALYKQASVRFTAQDYALAANLYRASFEADPANVQALIMLGVTHYKRDDLSTATGLLRDALQRTPFDPAAHYYLGMCRAQAGEYRRAVLCYRRALSVAPDFAECWFALSLAYDRIDMPRESREAMQAFSDHATPEAKRAAQQLIGVK